MKDKQVTTATAEPYLMALCFLGSVALLIDAFVFECAGGIWLVL